MTNCGGGFGQQPSAHDTRPTSCLLFSSTALTTKGRRILATVKFANVFQVRYYKTTFPCTEFVDHKWYHQDRCDRPLKKTKPPIKEETYKQWTKDNFHHRRNNSIHKKASSLYRNINRILKKSIVSSTLGQCPAGYDTTLSLRDKNAVCPFVIPISGT